MYSVCLTFMNCKVEDIKNVCILFQNFSKKMCTTFIIDESRPHGMSSVYKYWFQRPSKKLALSFLLQRIRPRVKWETRILSLIRIHILALFHVPKTFPYKIDELTSYQNQFHQPLDSYCKKQTRVVLDKFFLGLIQSISCKTSQTNCVPGQETHFTQNYFEMKTVNLDDFFHRF